jgi:hypothetical protein
MTITMPSEVPVLESFDLGLDPVAEPVVPAPAREVRPQLQAYIVQAPVSLRGFFDELSR